MVRKRKCRKNWSSRAESANAAFINDETLVSTEQSSNNRPSCPLQTPRSSLDANRSGHSIRTTPINKKRTNSRRRSSLNKTLNVTNLNILFDASYINQNTPPQETRKLNNTPKVNESTQTTDGERKSGTGAIVETPRISQLSLVADLISELKSPVLGSANNLKSKVHYLDSKVNLNPYVHNPDVKFYTKDNPSISETSFFATQLHNLKSSSTPIEEIAAHILKKSPFAESPKNVNCNVDAVKVDKISNLIYQSTPLEVNTDTDKVSNLTINSPKPPCPGNFTIIHNLTPVSKCRSDYRTFSSAVQSKPSSIEVIFDGLKKISRSSIRWSCKIIDFCSSMGLAVKRSLSSLCKVTQPEQEGEEIEVIACKCEEYRSELSICNSNLDMLKSELCQVRSHCKELTKELQNAKEHLTRFQDNKYKEFTLLLQEQKEELAKFRMEFEEFKREKSTSVASFVCAVAPPPPPPPPPPPLPPLMPNKTSTVKINKKVNKNNKENSRPLITVDDIKRVKLKKAAERTSPYRRSSQPMVTTDILRQVKLKPSSRSQTPISDLSSLSSTSPSSSLTKLLSDSTVWKVKRLKRVGGYSFDDFCRRNLLAKKDREWTQNCSEN